MVQEQGFQIPDSLIDASLKLTDQGQIDSLVKEALKDQIQNLIKPYLGLIPAVVAALLFFTLQALTSLVSLLIYPLLWLIFLILEKIGFVKFTTEMREVKKMVV